MEQLRPISSYWTRVVNIFSYSFSSVYYEAPNQSEYLFQSTLTQLYRKHNKYHLSSSGVESSSRIKGSAAIWLRRETREEEKEQQVIKKYIMAFLLLSQESQVKLLVQFIS